MQSSLEIDQNSDLDKLLQKKWISKYMKMAKTLAEDNNSCYSRKIGVILISEDNAPIGFGYNGSVAGSPHNDEPEYLLHLWQDLLDDHQKDFLKNKYNLLADDIEKSFVNKFSYCKTCPRKLLEIPSGQYLELCNCAHAERNAISNAAKLGHKTKNSIMYCWCGCPCHECGNSIIQSGVQAVVCLKTQQDYSKSTRWNFMKSRVKLIEIDPTEI